jgi:flavin-dependent dehydrogenase
VDIFFHKDYEGGYAWFFPKGRTANVGLGVVSSKTSHLPDLLNDFLNNLKEAKKISRVEILSRTGGSIPCEPRRQTLFGNILLVGDAAGHAHPITGAGILNAVIGGEMAGRIAAEAVARGDFRHLENYEIEWRETFGESLSYGSFKRAVLEKNWNKREVSFESLIKKTWVSFREYSRERRSASWKQEGVLNTSRLA